MSDDRKLGDSPRDRAITISTRVLSGFDVVARLAGFLAAGATVLLLALLLGEVLQRNLRGSSVPGAVPIAEMLLAITIFGALAYTQRQGGHVRVEIGELLLPKAFVAKFRGAIWICIAMGLFIMAFYGWDDALASLARGENKTSGQLAWPTYPARFTVAIGFFLNAVGFVLEGIHLLVSRTAEDEPPKPPVAGELL